MVHSLLAHSLSLKGYTQALQIMAMENVLRELEVGFSGVAAGDSRNPDAYYLSFYGRPAMEDTWGWRFLGHHLSLSYTIIGQRYISVTPCNMGAQPAQAGVLDPLVDDDLLGFTLVNSLTAVQSKLAIIHDVAPADFVTRQVPHIGDVEYPDTYDLGILDYRITDADREALRFSRDEPAGIAASDLDAAQSGTLTAIVDCFLGRLPDAIANQHRGRLDRRGPENLFFAWAGGSGPGESHYYRLQSPDMLVEFDNAVDGANHIHSNWRDLDNDLGHDLLLDHYEHERTSGHHLATRLQSSVPHRRTSERWARTVDIGLLMAVRNPGRKQNLAQVYQDYISDAVYAEQLGFDHVRLGEHRMTPDQWTPSPVAVMANIAARTSTLRMGPAVMCLPFHNPLRLAEDFAVLDNLSNGRVEFGFGVGSQFEEFRTYGIDPATRLGRTYEAAAFIEKCFSTDETFSWEGKYYSFPDVTFTTRPVQDKLPFYASAIGPQSLAKAGAAGYNLIAIRQPGYDKALADNGHDPAEHKAISLQVVHVAPTEEQAWEESIDGLHHFVNFYAQRRDLEGVLPGPEREVTRDMIRSGRMHVGAPSVGTPEQVTKKLLPSSTSSPAPTGSPSASATPACRPPRCTAR